MMMVMADGHSTIRCQHDWIGSCSAFGAFIFPQRPPGRRTIGGRGVGNWEGDQPNYGPGGGGEWFLDPQEGGTSSAFLRGGSGGKTKKTGKFSS